MTISDKQTIEELIHDKSVFRSVLNGVPSGLRIIERGDRMFYQEGMECVICEIDPRYGLLAINSINEWSSGEQIGDQERQEVMRRMCALYLDAYDEVLRPV